MASFDWPAQGSSSTGTVTTVSVVTANGLSGSVANPTAAPAITISFAGENNDGNTGTAQTISWATYAAHKSTLTGNVVYTLSNPVVSGSYLLRLYTGAGGFAVTWPASVKWTDLQGAPGTTTLGKMILISMYWDGTNYWASYGTFTA